MKYSQAIIVATIGSAALVSAAPTVGHGAAHPQTHHNKPAHRGSEKAKGLTHNIKQGASTALRTAGGAEGVATHLGNVVNLYHASKQLSSPEVRAVTEPAAKAPGGVHHKKESLSAASPSETEEQTTEAVAHHHHREKVGTKQPHPHHKSDKIHHRIKETAGHVNPTLAKSNKAHPKTNPGETTPVATVPTGPPAPVAVRDFVEEELQARLFDHFKQKYREAKAERLQKKADKAAAKAAGGQEQPVYRDLLDEEYLAARDFEDELEARGLRDAFKAAKHAIFHKHTPSAPVDPSQDPNMVARSFLDEEDLFERDFADFEDLEARGIRDAFHAAKHMIFHKHAPAAPAEDPSMVARGFFDEEDLFERDFDFDDLEARAGGGIGKGIGRVFTKARNALKGHKTDIALTGASIGATVGSTVGVSTRDLSDEEFDELVARAGGGIGKGIGRVFTKARNALKGHKTDIALTGATIGATVGSTVGVSTRDLSDEELNELVARGILSKVFNKVRGGLKGHKTDAAFTAMNVGASMSGGQRRSLDDFEELEMRDFELNELD